MRLLATVAAWVSCACLLVNFTTLPSPIPQAQAKSKTKKKAVSSKKIRRCMSFEEQMGKDNESVDLSLVSSCEFDVICSIEWEVSCATASDANALVVDKRSSTLAFRDRFDVSVSTTFCEADWEIKNTRWSC